MAKSNSNGNDVRFKIGKTILCYSIIAISLLAGIIFVSSIIKPYINLKEAKDIFTLLLPLFGTWVGTVLAYYFSKENFEAANKSVGYLVEKLTPMQKLAGTPVKSKMIPRQVMAVLKMTAGDEKNILLKDKIIGEMEKDNKDYRRLPVLDTNDKPLYMIHRSMIDKFISQKALESTAVQPVNLSSLTLADILAVPEFKAMFTNGFATVREDATLADVKNLMDNMKDCQDVFITKSGTKDEPVIGWVTNIIVAEAAQV